MGSKMKLETAERLKEKLTKMALRLDSATVSDEDIDQGLELIKEVHAFLDQNDYDKSRICAAVLGATGVGKSTVVSLLFGDGKLLVHHEDEYTRVLTAEKPLPGVNIQYGSLSKTLLPAVLHAGVGSQSVVVFDMPGTQDTRGPFAELVAHFVMKWLFANHKNVQFIIVATPPQERSQEVTLASTINRACAGGSNAVLVYTKCDADFDPRITTKMKAINPENRNIPAFTLPRPRKLDEEGLDYSSPQREMKLSVLRELTSPVKQSKAFAEFVPDSAQLLLRNFRNRSIEFARDALSQAFLSAYLKYNPQESRYTLSTVSELLNILENPDPLMFEDFLGQIQWLVPQSGSISGNHSVQRAVERLNLMEIWSGGALIRCKNEWFSTKCRSKLEQIKRDLNCLYSSVHKYQAVVRKRSENTIVVSGWNLQLGSGSRVFSAIKDFVNAISSRTEDIPTVVLIGFKSVTIKVELRVWANVVIVSPEVFITKIDLSAEGQAPPPVPLCAKPGQNGLHGAPGRPGGNLTVICKELVSSQFVKRSKGQRGGDGQNAGDAIDGAGPEYHLLRLRTDLETLMNRLTSLKEWESVLSYLPVGIRLDERSKRDSPPDVGHMALTAAGSAIAATGVAVSGCLPILAPIVAPTMIPVGTGMIGKGMQRYTQTTLELYRWIEQSKGAVRPGRVGQGGYGGRGGEFYVVESGNEIKICGGASGEQGKHGLSGKSLQTVLLKGTVTQEYGIFGCRRGEPSMTISVEMNDPTQASLSGFSPEQQKATTRNPLMPLSVVENYYEEAFAELKKCFPPCDFPDVEMP